MPFLNSVIADYMDQLNKNLTLSKDQGLTTNLFGQMSVALVVASTFAPVIWVAVASTVVMTTISSSTTINYYGGWIFYSRAFGVPISCQERDRFLISMVTAGQDNVLSSGDLSKERDELNKTISDNL
ncbi:unnamed protein product [Vicia faba]|uniref:Uncharacterized protein n=1 Tax=Vicia faba TaxID=3906 RepID=A0AAV0YJV2_VICFA|nr:unnamed protein product [Vicia faba]